LQPWYAESFRAASGGAAGVAEEVKSKKIVDEQGRKALFFLWVKRSKPFLPRWARRKSEKFKCLIFI
jgi:hypothetical protein